MTADTRWLIVNADDFGLGPGVNAGIIAAHRSGVVTSASLMVRWPSAVEAAALARAHPRLGIGLHLDLGEWAHRGGVWVPLYEVAPLDDMGAVAGEVARQVAAFRRLMGREPTHLDSHQHVHREEPVRAVALAAARDLGVPLRHHGRAIRYCGDFYGQWGAGVPYPEGITVERLLAILSGLPSGGTELACHPGLGDDLDTLDTMYRAERATEVRSLCDQRVRAAIADLGLRLCSFGDLPAGLRCTV